MVRVKYAATKIDTSTRDHALSPQVHAASPLLTLAHGTTLLAHAAECLRNSSACQLLKGTVSSGLVVLPKGGFTNTTHLGASRGF